MRAVVQRVTQASVTVDGELLGRIGKGFMILLGVADGDTVQVAEKMADKICRLRIFEDENGKTNLSLADVEGELLIISQFTLYADCRKGQGRRAPDGGVPVQAVHGTVQPICGCGGKGPVWRGHEGGAFK